MGILNRRIAGLVASVGVLLAISQPIFWLALGFAESRARPDAPAGPDIITMLPADQHGEPLPGVDAIQVPLMAEPAYGYADPQHYPRALFIHTFTHTDPDKELGVLLSWSRRIVDVRLNGTPLKTQTPTDIWGILGGFEPVIYTFPREYLHDGENELSMLNSGRSKKILPYFFVGEVSSLFAALNWSRLFTIDLVLAAIGVLVFSIILNAVIDWPREDRYRIRTLLFLLSAWTLRNLTFLGIDGGLPDPFRLLSHFLVTYLFLYAFVVAALGWTRRPLWALGVASTVFVACCAVVAISLAISTQVLFDIAFRIETAATLIVGGAVLCLFADYWHRNHRADSVEILLMLVCMTAVVVDAVDDRWQISVPFRPDLYLTFYAAPMCGLLLALGMVASLAAQSTRARKAIEGVNELLSAKLSEQEERLAASYERESSMVKEQTLLEERQRIIGDMHDGLGGNMMSLLLRARRSELNNEDLVKALDANMNDLRLIIDSFDQVGDNLEFALSMFRQRVEPWLRSAGVDLHYETRAVAAVEGFGPQAVLHIYRIIQEACSNAVNHGQARNVTIRLAPMTDAGAIELTVEDDGHGFDTNSAAGGRGLDNIARRAEALGGESLIESGRSGTKVTLRLPVRD